MSFVVLLETLTAGLTRLLLKDALYRFSIIIVLLGQEFELLGVYLLLES